MSVVASRQALIDLADRCEREESSQELDEAIAFGVGWRLKEGHWWRNPVSKEWVMGVPCFSTSLDAAVTLVPEGWARIVQWIGAPYDIEATARLWLPVKRTKGLQIEQVTAAAKTEALALCAAALRARAAEIPQGDGK